MNHLMVLHIDDVFFFFLGVCMAQFVSKFNSKYETHNYRKKLSSYGIFQISSKYWCDDGHTPGASNGCGIPCSGKTRQLWRAIKHPTRSYFQEQRFFARDTLNEASGTWGDFYEF